MGFAKIGSTIESAWKITNESDNAVNLTFVPLLAESSAKLTLSSESLSLLPKETK